MKIRVLFYTSYQKSNYNIVIKLTEKLLIVKRI